MPLIDKLGAALCTVVLGSRKSAWLLYACDPAGPISTRATLDTASPALDPVYLGEPVMYGPGDPWPDGLPFGPDDEDLPTHGHAIVLPLQTAAGIGGFVTLHGIPRPIDDAQLRRLRALTRVFSLSLTNAQLGSAAERLANDSPADMLTDTLNRGAFYEHLRAEWRRSARELTSFAIALLDVDHFSRFNDLYGQPAGDRALHTVAKTIAAAGLRSSDFVARYDGDVFAIVLPVTNEEGALALCDRVRTLIADRGLEHSVSPFGVVTASIGVASMRPNSRRVPAALLYEADAALHRAKQAGRNRVAGKEEIRTSPPAAPRSLLPEHAHPFIGREPELAELAASTEAVLTILGAPGAGKSALALEYARRVPERAVIVDLEHAGASGVVARVARALEIVAYSGGQLATALRDRTQHEPLLIVLDGCDDALDGAIGFVEAVHGIRGLRTIVTCRTPLRLPGERVFHIVERSR
ncbi:MAG TPA: diguanylate cyclase [Candidatus Acidoferrales bacterium]|nr:diguanylate cyclase [Candidatus Acidoferrales bacterium]